jgi:hypothetical protein
LPPISSRHPFSFNLFETDRKSMGDCSSKSSEWPDKLIRAFYGKNRSVLKCQLPGPQIQD